MKKWITMALALAMTALLPCRARALSARQGALLDAQTGRLLWEQAADKPGLIASTTKIMTALVVCQRCNVLDRMEIPEQAVGIEGSSMYLRAGEVLTVQELLWGLMLSSGNDAAVALAIYCAGTVEGFVGLMNDKARELGLHNTHFANPHGLDAPEHYSTPRDLAVLAAYAMEDPVFAMTVSTKTVRLGQRQLTNHNKLLWRVPGANGVKTGYTKAAGRILVSGASRDGRQLIAVTMDDPRDWEDHAALLEEGFCAFTVRRIVAAGETVGQIPIAGGQAGETALIALQSFSYPVAAGEKITLVLPGGFVYAPVRRGKQAGTAHILLDGKPVGKVPLCYGESVGAVENLQ